MSSSANANNARVVPLHAPVDIDAAPNAEADNLFVNLADSDDDAENDNSPPLARYAHMVNAWVHAGNSFGATPSQQALAALPLFAPDTETFREGFKEWLELEHDNVTAARAAVETLRPQRLSAMQRYALMRSGSPSVRTLARDWNTELRRTEALAQRTEAALRAAAQLDELLPQLRARIDVMHAASAKLEALSFPADPESAWLLIDTFKQRGALSRETADELTCIFCRSTVAELGDAPPPFFRINSTCSSHAACVNRERFCDCNVAFCQPCVVRAMGYAYANHPGELHADGVSRDGVQQARGAIKCPQCAALFCFTELQPLQPRVPGAPPPAAKRAAEGAEDVSGARKVRQRTRHRRLTRVADSSDDRAEQE